MEKHNQQLSFSSLSVSKRKIKRDFFRQMDLLLDWVEIEKKLKLYYSKGVSVDGRPSYSALLLFKMSLLQTWYGLSDYEVEDRVNDSLSFMGFVGLTLEDAVPDNTVLSRFRTALTKQGAYEKLLTTINEQLASKGILLKTGAIVDASLTDTLRKPRGKKAYEVVTDRAEDAAIEPPIALVVTVQKHVDTEADWLKKAGRLHFGYKRHTATNNDGLVLAVVTTAANQSDIVHLQDVVDKTGITAGARVRADKGYCSASNRQYLKDKQLKDGIMHKAVKGKPLTSRQLQFNTIVSKIRYRIERSFGSMNSWFGAGIARYVGQAKTHTQHLLEAMAYNLYRSPGIVMSNSQLLGK